VFRLSKKKRKKEKEKEKSPGPLSQETAVPRKALQYSERGEAKGIKTVVLGARRRRYFTEIYLTDRTPLTSHQNVDDILPNKDRRFVYSVMRRITRSTNPEQIQRNSNRTETTACHAARRKETGGQIHFCALPSADFSLALRGGVGAQSLCPRESVIFFLCIMPLRKTDARLA
jgi:hypothetical protein